MWVKSLKVFQSSPQALRSSLNVVQGGLELIQLGWASGPAMAIRRGLGWRASHKIKRQKAKVGFGSKAFSEFLTHVTQQKFDDSV